jgi:inner membrane protein
MRPIKTGPGLKIIGVAILVLLMGIPVSLIGFVTSDRNREARNAIHSTADQWGGASQVLQGPWLIVPHKVSHVKKITTRRAGCKGSDDECLEERNEIIKVTKHLVFAPQRLDGETKLASRELKRGIHKVPVYDAETTITGTFAPLDARKATARETSEPQWDQAYLTLAVSDQRTFKDKATLTWDNTTVAFEPGVVPQSSEPVKRAGIHAPLTDLKQGAAPRFTIVLKQKGGLNFGLAPRGQDIAWTMTSNWPDPSFGGRFLPATREVSKDGFSATWSLPNVARAPQVTQNIKKLEGVFGEARIYDNFITYPSYPAGGTHGVDIAVKLHQPIDNYSLINRALKYALLFIGLVFLTLFLLEMAAGGKPIHPIQYLFVGLANAVFYLLLLAFSENIGFAPAYAVASSATALLIGLYVWAVLSTLKRTMIVVAALIVIYGLLWTILNLEDFALMVGSIIVFAALAISMYATRKVDWYGRSQSPKVDEAIPSPQSA